MKFQYNIPTKILFGKGQLSRLSRAGLPGKKAGHQNELKSIVRTAARPLKTLLPGGCTLLSFPGCTGGGNSHVPARIFFFQKN
ncbi:MAG: hypothetical protein EOM65_07095 [Synergistales bacterium]|nr:hypothetical protein [Synergistales bacterium]